MTTTTHQMEDSGTTLSSSIINCEEAAEYSPFIFDILKKEKDKDGRGDNDNKVLVTRHLFPVIPGEVAAAGRTAAQWLNLSYGAAEPSNSRQELKPVQQKQQQQQVKKNRRGPRSRSSQYRGVTFYRRTSRWESHIWDCGKQVYLGGFDTAHAAARTYDRAAIKFRGVDADLNFNLSDYEEDMKQMKHLSKEEFVLILRPQSSGFARGSSKYRGVALNKCSRWEASMGQLLGKNMAYDKAAIKYNGGEAVTNFEPDAYQAEMLLDSNNGGSSSSYHNLDLSLGISQPSSIDPIHCDACEMANKERPLLDSSTYASIGMHLHPLHGITMAPQNYEHRDKEKKRVQSVSSARFANWAREMQNSNTGNIALMPQLSNAASSGFCSSGRNMFLATPNSSNAINNSHFYNYRN